jgi:Zn-dependent protease with chaperone function
MDRKKVNEYLLEIDWKWAALQYGITTLIQAFFALISIFSTKSELSTIPIDKNLTTKLNDILKSSKKFTVHIFKEKSPNAFCLFSPNIYITSGCQKMCTEKELLAICLHEAGHINDYHSWYRVFAMIGIGSLFHTILRVWIHENTSKDREAQTALDYNPYVWMIELALTMQVTSVIIARAQGRGQEYYADSFATKYGYGDYLITGLRRVIEWSRKREGQRCTNKICKALIWLSEAMDEHPSLEDRVAKILEDKKKLKELGQLPVAKRIEFIKTSLGLE